MLLSVFLMGSTCVVRASDHDSDSDSDSHSDSDKSTKKHKDGTTVVVVVDTTLDDENDVVGGNTGDGLSAGIPQAALNADEAARVAMAYSAEERGPEVAIPEPTAVLLFAVGAVALASRRRRPPR